MSYYTKYSTLPSGTETEIGVYVNAVPGLTSITFNHSSSGESFTINSNPDLLHINFQNLTASVFQMQINYNPSLLTITASKFKNTLFSALDNISLKGIDIRSVETCYLNLTGNNSLEFIDLSSLVNLTHLELSPMDGPLNLYMPALLECGDLVADNSNAGSGVISVSAPLLVRAGGFEFAHSPNITTLNFPNLLSCNGFICNANPLLATMSLNNLTGSRSYLNFSNNPSLVSASFLNLVDVIGFVSFANCSALTYFNAPNWLPATGEQVDFYGCALDETSVNHILARCVAGQITGSSIRVNAGTNAIPTGQGAIDVGVLAAAPNSIQINS